MSDIAHRPPRWLRFPVCQEVLVSSLTAAVAGRSSLAVQLARMSRGWTAPDVARARRLVAAYGRTGCGLGAGGPAPLGRYFAALLRVRVHATGPLFDSIYDPRTPAQIGFVGWALDYVSPSNLFAPHSTCSSLADRRKETPPTSAAADSPQFDRALAAEGAEAAERWAAVDRRIAWAT
jgi:hypothetical protein